MMAEPRRQLASKWIAAAAAASTPLLIYFGGTQWPPVWTALTFGMLAVIWSMLLIFAHYDRASAGPYLIGLISALTISIGTWVVGGDVLVLAFPTIMCWIFAIPFTTSLLPGQTPIITRFAIAFRTRAGIQSELPHAGLLHCRRFTIIWSVFLVANGGVAAALAFFAARDVWATYSCVISYALMAALLFVERLLRPATHK